MSTQLLLGVEAAAEAAGWDNPGLLYLVEGTNQEPTFSVFAELTGHPCVVLQQMYADGIRVEALGMALVVEGKRHRRVDELEDCAPKLYETMLKEAEGDQTAVETAWLSVQESTPPSAMPDSLTCEVRNAVLVLHTGWTLTVTRDRGGEPQVLDMVPPKRITLSRVPDFMWQFLNGREPTD